MGMRTGNNDILSPSLHPCPHGEEWDHPNSPSLPNFQTWTVYCYSTNHILLKVLTLYETQNPPGSVIFNYVLKVPVFIAPR